MDDAQRKLLDARGSVIGIDPSLTGTAVCVMLHDLTHLMERFSSPPSKGLYGRFQRYGDLVERVVRVVRDCRPRLVLIEGYAFGAQGNAGRWSAEYGALLRQAIMLASIEQGTFTFTVEEVAPNSLKKFAAGHGQAPKAGVSLMLQRRYGVYFSTDDEYDAYGLARMAAKKIGWDRAEKEQLSLL